MWVFCLKGVGGGGGGELTTRVIRPLMWPENKYPGVHWQNGVQYVYQTCALSAVAILNYLCPPCSHLQPTVSVQHALREPQHVSLRGQVQRDQVRVWRERVCPEQLVLSGHHHLRQHSGQLLLSVSAGLCDDRHEWMQRYRQHSLHSK